MTTDRPSLRKPARGFALVEAAVAVVIVSVMLVAALRLVGASGVSQAVASERLRASALAQGLMTEILDRSYDDPNEASILGIELSEVAGGRASFDDVDDYGGYTESPPRDRTGAVIPGWTGWSRQVAVDWVNPANLSQARIIESGVRRITVTVKRGGRTLLTLTALRTRGAQR